MEFTVLYRINFDNVEERRGGRCTTQEDADSYISVDPIEYNTESPNMVGANISTTPLKSSNNSRNVGGALMEETNRAPSSHACSETPSGMKPRNKKKKSRPLSTAMPSIT